MCLHLLQTIVILHPSLQFVATTSINRFDAKRAARIKYGLRTNKSGRMKWQKEAGGRLRDCVAPADSGNARGEKRLKRFTSKALPGRRPRKHYLLLGNNLLHGKIIR